MSVILPIYIYIYRNIYIHGKTLRSVQSFAFTCTTRPSVLCKSFIRFIIYLFFSSNLIRLVLIHRRDRDRIHVYIFNGVKYFIRLLATFLLFFSPSPPISSYSFPPIIFVWNWLLCAQHGCQRAQIARNEFELNRIRYNDNKNYVLAKRFARKLRCYIICVEA